MIHKTFYYDFIPTKAEEEACKATNTPFKITKTLTEIRDVYPPPPINPLNPRVIKKVITPPEAGEGKIVISFTEIINHIFRYWTTDMANHVVNGNKQNVVIWDVTDIHNPTSYVSENILFEAGPDCEYFVLGCMDLIRGRCLIAGDVIGLFWDIKSATFQFLFFDGAMNVSQD